MVGNTARSALDPGDRARRDQSSLNPVPRCRQSVDHRRACALTQHKQFACSRRTRDEWREQLVPPASASFRVGGAGARRLLVRVHEPIYKGLARDGAASSRRRSSQMSLISRRGSVRCGSRGSMARPARHQPPGVAAVSCGACRSSRPACWSVPDLRAARVWHPRLTTRRRGPRRRSPGWCPPHALAVAPALHRPQR